MKRWLFVVLVFSGCEKTSDLPAMQQELLGTAKNFEARFAELDRRGAEVAQRLKHFQNDVDANNTLSDADKQFMDARAILNTTPNEIVTALKSGKPEALRRIADTINGAPSEKAAPVDVEIELQRASDAFHNRLEKDYTAINAELDAVESAVMLDEAGPPPPAAEPASGSGSGAP